MKKKLSLDKIQVRSFVTQENKKNVKGGDNSFTCLLTNCVPGKSVVVLCPTFGCPIQSADCSLAGNLCPSGVAYC